MAVLVDPNQSPIGTNSTITPLGSSETFTGKGERNGNPSVLVSCHTDQAGTLFFDFSNDGTNWDSTFPVAGFTVAAGINEFHTAVKGGRWFRVRFVNGSTAQTHLRLYTYFGFFGSPNAPLDQSLGSDSDAAIVRAVIEGSDASGDGSYRQIKTDSTGSLIVGDFDSDVAIGEVAGVQDFHLVGFAEDLQITDTDGSGGADLQHPIVADSNYAGFHLTGSDTVDVVSTSASDLAVTGNGARNVHLFGVNGSGQLVDETISLDGTTAVQSTNSYQCIYDMRVDQAGDAANGNFGTLTCSWENDQGNATLQTMDPNMSRAQTCVFQVPATMTGGETVTHAVILDAHASIVQDDGATSYCRVHLMHQPSGDIFQPELIAVCASQVGPVDLPKPIALGVGDRVKWQVWDVSDAGSDMSVNFTIRVYFTPS